MDVEGILNQIRERVVSEHAVLPNDARLSTAVHSNGSATNHDDALQRLRTQLAIAGRAADRLPPVFSNREGALARFELWLKNKSKPLTRWFTWEQVNFNRAVNDALCDVVEILKSEAQELAALRGQLNAWQTQLAHEAAEFRSNRSETDATVAQLKMAIANLTTESGQRETEMANNYARLEANLVAEYRGLLAEHTKLADQVIELAAQLRAEDREIRSEQHDEINRRLSQLAADLKEEQRVCFRQISLETGESAVLEDRARRALLARLEKLEEALKTGKRS